MKFVDLGAQFSAYEDEIRREIDRVLSSSAFILGPAVEELEKALCNFCSAKHCISCASGTDALLLGLMAKDVQVDDEIIVPAFTFVATASMVALLKARPVFVDVDPVSYTIDPEKIRESITPRTRGIIPVSLYGQCPDMDVINQIAQDHGLWVMEDAAQSFGAAYKGRMSCNLSEIATTSFFPAKPLGCFGDGGAVFTNNDELADNLRLFRNHGQIKRYHHTMVGINGRLDTLQAAILKVKLAHFKDELKKRQEAADRYTSLLEGYVDLPVIVEGNTSSWAQYTIRVPRREVLQKSLADSGIPTAVHYPLPLGKQKAFAHCGRLHDSPVSDELASSFLSLPMHAFITENEQREICKVLLKSLSKIRS